MGSIILEYGLLIWFAVSCYLVWNDPTFSKDLRLLGEVINILCIIYIMANLFNSNYNDNQAFYVLYYGLGILLLAWYFYFTTQDIINPGYDRWEHIVYVGIDILFIIYLITSMTLTYCMKHIDNIAKFSIQHQITQFTQHGFYWF